MQENSISDEFLQYESEFKYTSEQLKQKLKQGDLMNEEMIKQQDECKRCIKMMETETQTKSVNTRKILMQKIIQYKKLYDQIEEKINEQLVKQKKVDNLKSNLFENDLIIEEIDKLTTETEQIALNVDQKMNAGTIALQQSKNKKADLKSNLRKSEFTIQMMNNKVTLDKASLVAIIFLLGIIDVFAIYLKFL